MNHELYQVYKHADIVKVIQRGRVQWAGHVARMPDERAAKTIFSREPDSVVGLARGGCAQ